ncbi:hypothetical protein ARMSODRAFT_973820 [Armillaria solidipes]|uniref:Uncharacterized protein n=1 Tax=Armillaria solidipes TaxID=1076256 RepID=A0A2H3BZA2_9AGAR|nr:hypothetical protein ARMSODRAFT_973820 [Armillaria solidipes]
MVEHMLELNVADVLDGSHLISDSILTYESAQLFMKSIALDSTLGVCSSNDTTSLVWLQLWKEEHPTLIRPLSAMYQLFIEHLKTGSKQWIIILVHIISQLAMKESFVDKQRLLLELLLACKDSGETSSNNNNNISKDLDVKNLNAENLNKQEVEVKEQKHLNMVQKLYIENICSYVDAKSHDNLCMQVYEE